MARQVRPWSAKPFPDEAPRVRVSDRGADQQVPSGTVSMSMLASKVRMYGSNLPLLVVMS
ncbi:hypothetical protein DN412_41880 [Cupriavidus lacunae]|uniref:Uncharacterized protein n=1 Tax=Cupriavidus lacunae TaxID=2666307 RepID=A0A370MWW9_9BURK|nr:hypothetical protein DN412_41880 [Cupriavidus lacunae]